MMEDALKEDSNLSLLLCSHLEALFDFHDEICETLTEEYKSKSKEIATFFATNGVGELLIGEKTPQQIKKRSKQLETLNEGNDEESISKHENSESAPVKSTRPVRAAKMNLDLREKPITMKIRRPSNFDPNFTCNVYIKQEKIEDKVETMQIDDTRSTASDNSVLIINKHNAVVEIESDGEADKMPPPSAPAPKKRGRKKKSSLESPKIELPKPIKTEKISMANLPEKNLGESTQSGNVSKTHSKKGKNKIPKPIIVKEEKLSLPSTDNESLRETEKRAKKNKSQKNNRAGSSDSVYEDAMPSQSNSQSDRSLTQETEGKISDPELADNTKIMLNGSNPSEAVDPLERQNSSSNKTKNSSNNERNSDKICDSTFVSAKDLPTAAHNIASALADSTFAKTSGNVLTDQATFILEKKDNANATVTLTHKDANATVTLIQDTDVVKYSDATFNVRTNPETEWAETYIRDSIITEDNSDEVKESPEVPKAKYKPKPKCKLEKNQLFNPFVQSPLKKKIEAFEKVAADAVGKDANQRQTRKNVKSKQKDQNDENTDIKNRVLAALKDTSKAITPTIGRPLGRILTPSQSSTSITPTIGNITKKLPNSASKAIGITKALSTISKTTSVSRSRENSSEDLKRGFQKFQEMAAERKKKREEKQQQALLVREQKEKERAERLRRLQEEREEKMKSAEQKRNLEEIQKNLKILEEKNEQKRKLEKQKMLEKQAAAAAAKKEREMLENLKVQKAKEKMQLEYLKNQKLLQAKAKEIPQYNFDMLQTDDETDEEDSESKKRPPIPEWSKKEVRHSALEMQIHMPTRIIDNYFLVQPLTPDLREIFPAIDPRYCKRNSSMFWSTPPRYSQLTYEK